MVPAGECNERSVWDQYSPTDSSAGKLFRSNQVVDAAQAQRKQRGGITFRD
jgi:hypothetical protein